MTIAGRLGPRFAWIDPIRMMCALAVMAFHYLVVVLQSHVLPVENTIAPGVVVYGQFGVEIFFIISGFVISLSTMGRNWAQFARARILRLYPAYWIAMALTAATLWTIQPQIATLDVPSIGTFLVNLTMLQSLAHVPNVDPVYWSLAVELRFYALAALLIAVRIDINSRLLLIVWLGLCVGAPWLPGPVRLLTLQGFAPMFIAGICIRRLLAADGRIGNALLLGAAMSAQVPAMFMIYAQRSARDFIHYDPYIAICIVWAGTLVLLACAFAPNPRQFVTLFSRVGAATYPLYLIHCVLGMLCLTYALEFFTHGVAIAVVAAGMIALSALVALIVEPQLRKYLAVAIDWAVDAIRRTILPRISRSIASAANHLRGQQ